MKPLLPTDSPTYLRRLVRALNGVGMLGAFYCEVAPGHWISWDPAKGVGHIDTPDFEHDVTDMRPGLSGRTGSPESRIAANLGALCAFLGACAESRQYAARNHGDPVEGENSDLFPANVGEWAEMHSDELAMLAYELENPEE